MYLYRWHKPATPGGPVYSQISLEVCSEGSMSHELCLFCGLAFSGLCAGTLPDLAGGVRAKHLHRALLAFLLDSAPCCVDVQCPGFAAPIKAWLAQPPMFRVVSMQCGYETGEDRLYLRLPVMVAHKITDGEPHCWFLLVDVGCTALASGLCMCQGACMRQLPARTGTHWQPAGRTACGQGSFRARNIAVGQ